MNSFNARRREQAQAGLRNRQGFALLLEVLIVLFILGLIAGAYYGNVGERIMNARIEAEDVVLRDLADALRQSLNSTDLTNVNIAAIPGEIGGTDTPTQFSMSTSPTYLTTANNDWFAKLARLRGVPVTVGVSPGQQPQLSRILYNSMNQPRMLFIRPTVGADSVELMLVSLLATPDQLVMPAYQATDAWFDTIAGYDFTQKRLPIPAAWQSLLTANQQAAWNNGTGGSNINRLRVVRYSVKKYAYNVNNNSPTYYGWVYWNNGGGRYQAAPSSGATTTPTIVYGRQVICTSGLTEGAAVTNYNDPMQGPGSFTVK